MTSSSTLYLKGSIYDRKLYKKFLSEKLKANKKIFGKIQKKEVEIKENSSSNEIIFESEMENSFSNCSSLFSDQSFENDKFFDSKEKNLLITGKKDQNKENMKKIEQKLLKYKLNKYPKGSKDKPSFFSANFGHSPQASSKELITSNEEFTKKERISKPSDKFPGRAQRVSKTENLEIKKSLKENRRSIEAQNKNNNEIGRKSQTSFVFFIFVLILKFY